MVGEPCWLDALCEELEGSACGVLTAAVDALRAASEVSGNPALRCPNRASVLLAAARHPQIAEQIAVAQERGRRAMLDLADGGILRALEREYSAAEGIPQTALRVRELEERRLERERAIRIEHSVDGSALSAWEALKAAAAARRAGAEAGSASEDAGSEDG